MLECLVFDFFELFDLKSDKKCWKNLNTIKIKICRKIWEIFLNNACIVVFEVDLFKECCELKFLKIFICN